MSKIDTDYHREGLKNMPTGTVVPLHFKDTILELLDAYDELQKENVRLREGLNWQPIETVPKDGTGILCYDPQYKEIHECWWDDGMDEDGKFWPDLVGLNYHDGTMPFATHWMPLPEPPKALKEEE